MERELLTLERGEWESILTENADVKEEYHFRQLYDQVMIYFLKRMKNHEVKMNRAISFIIDSFKWREGGSFSDIDFRREDMLCGYIFRYGPHGAGLARCRILEALEYCRTLRSILKAPRLNVASLGGGPGNDAIGFCSAMSRHQFSGRMEIFVVDAAFDWVHSIAATEKLLSQGGFGDASDLFQQGKAKLIFAPFSLPGKLWELPMKVIDVFLICKLMSIMSWEENENLVQKLYLRMKESALILLIDSPIRDELWRDKFKFLYLSDDDQCYQSGNVERFGHTDRVTSHARIAVLRKRRHLSLSTE